MELGAQAALNFFAVSNLDFLVLSGFESLYFQVDAVVSAPLVHNFDVRILVLHDFILDVRVIAV